ncbi:MAG TPA: DNA starvation/stationary phase protection protein [Woeseiaceae bacterium]|nr:DNA starvation/stationary phase protection protein [Woeseiaceae bacterium]
MTQAVLKNEISDLTPNTGTNIEGRRQVAAALGDVLADAFRLYINAQGLHWNVEGPMFYSLHKLTEQQYQSIAASLDDIAERIRALGLPAPESLKEFEDRSAIDDLPGDVELKKRVQQMVSDYEKAVLRLARVTALAERNDDVKTADLLTERIGAYEEFAWMLRATIVS